MRSFVNYWLIFKTAIRSRFSFRMDFSIGILGTVLSNLLALITFYVLTLQFKDIGGWSLFELLLLYGMWLISHGIYATFMKNIESLHSLVQTKELDLLILKPVRPMVFILASNIFIFGIADLLLGLGLVVFSLNELRISVDGTTVLFLFGASIIGTAIEFSVSLLLSSAAFWLTRADNLMGLVFQLNFGVTQKMPINIFPDFVQSLLTLVLPFAFMNYYPVTMLLGKAPVSETWHGMQAIAPVVCTVIFCAGVLAWSRGLSWYKSNLA